MSIGLTVEKFIEHFHKCSGWKCESGKPITNDLTEFATERLGSTRDIDELHAIFCLSKGIKPFCKSTSP